jgi:pimeloyl-ACP methyl ester carboxylesterase/DNA-binding CsgD family transcriptional regulator
MDTPVRYARSADGSAIAYTASGSGAQPLIVVPHAGVGDMRSDAAIPAIRRAIDRLARRRAVVTYDHRGHGMSQRSCTDFSLDATATDLHAVAGQAHAPRVALFARGLAGPVAIAYAARYPERVTGIILWCAVARGRDYRITGRARAIGALMRHDYALYAEVMSLAENGWTELGRQLAASSAESVAPETLTAGGNAARNFDAMADAARLACPVLILHRPTIPEISLASARQLSSTIPSAQFHLIDGHGRRPFVGDWAESHISIEAFLRQISTASGEATAPAVRLTRREGQVAALVARGLTNAQIASRLDVSERTVETHIAHVFTKFGVHSRSRLAHILTAADHS